MAIDRLPVIAVVASFGLLLYTYLGYPVLMWFLGRLLPRREAGTGGPGRWPDVSILLSVYNEEAVIDARIRNLLALHYPPEGIQILIGSDGSTDGTCEIVRRWASDRIRLIAFAQRRGKTSVLNDLMPLAQGEIVVLTDANTIFHEDAVRELVVALWRHPSACAAVGRLELRSPFATGNLDGVYWRYETWVKTLESRFGCVLGANGAIYAFRRARYVPVPKWAIVDDFLIPMLMRLRRGGHVFFVPTARAQEASPRHVRDEFRRRVRIGAGDLQAVLLTWPLLLPWKGMVALAYVSHKVLRWLGPWLLLLGFLANLWLLKIPLFRLLFFAQLGGYGLALMAPALRRISIIGLPAASVRYFLVLNAALLLGTFRFVLGAARPFWSTTPRQAEIEKSPPQPQGVTGH